MAAILKPLYGTIAPRMLRELHQELGIQADYGQDTGQPVFDEASDLVAVGPNLVGTAVFISVARSLIVLFSAEMGLTDTVIALSATSTSRTAPTETMSLLKPGYVTLDNVSNTCSLVTIISLTLSLRLR